MLSLRRCMGSAIALASCLYSSCVHRLLITGASLAVDGCMRFGSCSMWDLPRSGIEPVSPAWAGGFFPTESPGKPSTSFLNCQIG